MNPNIVHIVYASDGRFAKIMGVSLVSLYENNKDLEGIIVYIMDGGIDDEDRKKLESISKKYGRSDINWIDIADINKELGVKVKTDRGSNSQYSRIFVSSHIPRSVDRVLYLDCDTIVYGSIKGLWNLDLQKKTVAALMDAFSPLYRKNIDLKDDDILFNSGVMLIDMYRWKKLDVERRILQYIMKKKGRIQQGDQGALNAILSRETYCFEPKFNAVTIFFDFKYKELLKYRKPSKGYYGEEKTREAIDSPVIIHYSSSFISLRPWERGCQHKYTDVWKSYMLMTPWSEGELLRDNVSLWKNIIIWFPRKLLILFAGIAQAFVRPMMFRIR